MKHLNIKVYGSVQGVFFRQSAQEKALALGIQGFARNEPEGIVNIEVEGNEAALEDFLQWCMKGPSSASVEKINEEWSDNIKGFKDFNIK